MRCTSSGPSPMRNPQARIHRMASGNPAVPCARIALSSTHFAVAGAATLIADTSGRAPLVPAASISHAHAE